MPGTLSSTPVQSSVRPTNATSVATPARSHFDGREVELRGLPGQQGATPPLISSRPLNARIVREASHLLTGATTGTTSEGYLRSEELRNNINAGCDELLMSLEQNAVPDAVNLTEFISFLKENVASNQAIYNGFPQFNLLRGALGPSLVTTLVNHISNWNLLPEVSAP